MPKAVEKDIPTDSPSAPSFVANAGFAPQPAPAQAHQQVEQHELAKMETMARGQADVARTGGAMVGLPNRGMVRLADLIDHDYVAEDHRSIFADSHKYLKDPKPGALYCWPAIEGKAANKTFAMERRGYYRRVEETELRDDIDIPIYTHKTATGEYVCCYDVALMEMPAEVVRKLRSFPRQGAAMRAAQGVAFKDFAGQTRDMTEGGVRASMDVTTDGGDTVHFEE